jgi:hypothetical protein
MRMSGAESATHESRFQRLVLMSFQFLGAFPKLAMRAPLALKQIEIIESNGALVRISRLYAD